MRAGSGCPDRSRASWRRRSDRSEEAITSPTREDATRFERSTLPLHDFACLADSLDFLKSWGDVAGRVLELAGCLAEGLARIPGVTVLAPARSSGLVSFTLGRDPGAAAEELRRADRVIVRTVPRPRAVRASAHFFNTGEELERLLRGVARLARD